MKLKSILFITALAAGFQSNAQVWVADSVTMGPGYSNDVFYAFNHNGAVSSAPNTNWHLAFSMVPPGPGGSVAIWGNHVMDTVSVYSLHLQASVKFATLSAADTIGKTGAAQALVNRDSTWFIGALNTTQNPVDLFDEGWGEYDINDHNVYGDSIFLVKTGSALYKVWVKQYTSLPADSTGYTVRVAKFDGSGDNTFKIYRKNGYTDRLFAYYNLTTGTISDREPNRENWDVIFTRYMELTPLGPGPLVPYPVTGVLSNLSTTVGRAQHIMPDQATPAMASYPLVKTLNAIGSTWKVFNMTTFQYQLADSNSYFIKSTNSNHYYQLQFTRFDGSSTGKIVFQRKDLGVTSVPTIAAGSINGYVVSPNPANNSANVMIDAKEATANTRIILTDITGKAVQQYTVSLKSGINAFSFNTAALPAGMYIVNTTNGDWKMTEKLMVQH